MATPQTTLDDGLHVYHPCDSWHHCHKKTSTSCHQRGSATSGTGLNRPSFTRSSRSIGRNSWSTLNAKANSYPLTSFRNSSTTSNVVGVFFEVNFWGPFNGIKLFLPRMLDHGEEGHIVNTSSFSGIQGYGHQSGYGSSKFALVGLSEFLRNDLDETNISVSVLCPHVVDTPIISALKQRVARDTASLIEEMAVPTGTVGSQVVQAILTKEFYVFCDGTHTRDMLEKRCRDMIAAMDRQFPESAND
jgi:short-subunit dehydrogenase involved in D-alanine esterification of teichoic acids